MNYKQITIKENKPSIFVTDEDILNEKSWKILTRKVTEDEFKSDEEKYWEAQKKVQRLVFGEVFDDECRF